VDKIKIQSFRDLTVWKEGHALVLLIYKITDIFPEKETFTLLPVKCNDALYQLSQTSRKVFQGKAKKKNCSFTLSQKVH